MNLKEVQGACDRASNEVALHDAAYDEKDILCFVNDIRLLTKAVPKLLAFVRAWDAYDDWKSGRVMKGNGDDLYANVQAARTALDE